MEEQKVESSEIKKPDKGGLYAGFDKDEIVKMRVWVHVKYLLKYLANEKTKNHIPGVLMENKAGQCIVKIEVPSSCITHRVVK